MSLVTLWVIVALGAGILEVAVPVFGFLFVALAALLSAVVALAGGGIVLQILVFAVASLVCLLVLRPLFVKRLAGQGVPSRTEALLGKIARSRSRSIRCAAPAA